MVRLLARQVQRGWHMCGPPAAPPARSGLVPAHPFASPPTQLPNQCHAFPDTLSSHPRSRRRRRSSRSGWSGSQLSWRQAALRARSRRRSDDLLPAGRCKLSAAPAVAWSSALACSPAGPALWCLFDNPLLASDGQHIQTRPLPRQYKKFQGGPQLPPGSRQSTALSGRMAREKQCRVSPNPPTACPAAHKSACCCCLSCLRCSRSLAKTLQARRWPSRQSAWEHCSPQYLRVQAAQGGCSVSDCSVARLPARCTPRTHDVHVHA